MPPRRPRAIRRCGVEYRLPVRASRTPHTRSAPLPLVGRGWGWGSESVETTRATTTTPLPSPPPTQVGLARLAQDKTRPGQARGARGREPTEFVASADSTSPEFARAEAPRDQFPRAFAAGLLFALALCVRPNIAPAAGILLAGGG